jgi:hypothetical protein
MLYRASAKAQAISPPQGSPPLATANVSKIVTPLSYTRNSSPTLNRSSTVNFAAPENVQGGVLAGVEEGFVVATTVLPVLANDPVEPKEKRYQVPSARIAPAYAGVEMISAHQKDGPR